MCIIMRSCGECVVCCIYPAINELEKLRLVDCKFLTKQYPDKDVDRYVSHRCENCTNYEFRPPSCSDYYCAWLLGHGNEDDRPDKLGMLFDMSERIENAIECRELFPGVANKKEIKEAIIRMSHGTGKVALVIDFYETKIVRVVGRPE